MFTKVHTVLYELMLNGNMPLQDRMGQMQLTLVESLVAKGEISQNKADTFNDVHNRLISTGL
ncbi:MAG: hypothetical protein DWQ04_17115 [Chloroflexi bacterium]|nr:MAG: hypothetical protein DWQ04_17115 [Chloroflexota bacterium]